MAHDDRAEAARRLGPDSIDKDVVTEEQLRQALQERDDRIRELSSDLEAVREELTAVYAGWSWRATQPLRLAWKLLSRIAPGLARRGPRRPTPPLPPPPPPDVEVLQAEYASKGLDGQPDTFVLYRIIGNDLHPRHRKGQSRDNVRFILDHEPPLEQCEKRWVVNRIVDPAREAEIIALLEEHRQPYLRVPFDWDEYRRVQWDLDSFPRPGFFLRGGYGRLGERDRAYADMQVRRHKNNYVMHNNGARNAALRDGRRRAKWILPWDGNCYVTGSAWSEIISAIRARPYLKYFVVPMARISNNRALLEPAGRPDAGEEPQILFRRDAEEEFDEAFPYGRRPKVALFWRLAVPGEWEGFTDYVWDPPRPARAREAGQFGRAGWVARLSSGREGDESPSREGGGRRGRARRDAIRATLDDLDEQVLRRALDPARLLAYDEQAIAALRPDGSGDGPPDGLAERLRGEAEAALGRALHAVVDKVALPPGGNVRDDRTYDRPPAVFDDTAILALAWRATGNRRYAEHGSRLVRRWFLAAESRTAPHLRHGFHYFLDAVRLLQDAGVIDDAERRALAKWLGQYLAWLLATGRLARERQARDHRGTCYDLQVAAIAAYLGDIPVLVSTFRTSRGRLLEQLAPDGSQPQELSRAFSAHCCCLNLQAWVDLATLAERSGDPLWDFSASDGRSLNRALEWLLPFMGEAAWPFGQARPFDRARFLPLRAAWLARCGEPAGGDPPSPPDRHPATPLFPPGAGIKPFWMLSCRPPSRTEARTVHRAPRAQSDRAAVP